MNNYVIEEISESGCASKAGIISEDITHRGEDESLTTNYLSSQRQHLPPKVSH